VLRASATPSYQVVSSQLEQAGFRQRRSTGDHVLALTTFIENGFQLNQKTWSYLAPFLRFCSFYVLQTPPLFHPNFGGVPVTPDRLCWGQQAHKP